METVETFKLSGPAVLTLLFLACLVAGCAEEVACGPGTVRAGGECIAVRSGASPTGDAGASNPENPEKDDSAADAGTTSPPGPATTSDGSTATPAGRGCDVMAGGCEAFHATLVTRVRAAQMAAGCATPAHDEAVGDIAQRYADLQAAENTFQPVDPNGDFSTQLQAAGIEYTNWGALFARNGSSPDSVVDGWLGRADSADLLATCRTRIGIGVSPIEGSNYITAILVSE